VSTGARWAVSFVSCQAHLQVGRKAVKAAQVRRERKKQRKIKRTKKACAAKLQYLGGQLTRETDSCPLLDVDRNQFKSSHCTKDS